LINGGFLVLLSRSRTLFGVCLDEFESFVDAFQFFGHLNANFASENLKIVELVEILMLLSAKSAHFSRNI
jgi:hypothetical protein